MMQTQDQFATIKNPDISLKNWYVCNILPTWLAYFDVYYV